MQLFENVSRKQTCCFTGPRPEKSDITEEALYKLIKASVLYLVDQGYTHFFSGMSRGFDLVASQVIIDMQNTHNISLICAIPYTTQSKSWSFIEQGKYDDIISKARHTICMSDRYFATVFYARNRLMVDNSSKVITYYNKTGGGTKYTLDYAKTKGLDIINIFDDSFQPSLF